MSVAVVIPTIPGREEAYERSVAGYSRDPRVMIVTVRGADCAGVGWQRGADEAAARGARYLHLSSDDIGPLDEGWLDTALETIEAGKLPADKLTRPDGDSAFWGLGTGDIPDWTPATSADNEHPACPFCTMEQWAEIGPMIPQQYGIDIWFGWRAKRLGLSIVARQGYSLYHEEESSGRDWVGSDGSRWTYEERLVFDAEVAFPLYKSGSLRPDERHQDWGTSEGRDLARRWLEANVHRGE